MHTLAAHFHELLGSSREYRQWSVAVLDYSAESTRAGKPMRLAGLLPMVRQTPVCVLRKGERLASFGGRPSARLVDEWLGKLKMGEVAWERLQSDGQ